MTKKKLWIVISIISLFLIVIGISYAYWSLIFTQDKNNVVMTDCFEIEFIEGNAINLSKAYPVSDSDGMKNNPYTFTIKNMCTSSADYQINLETLVPSGKKLPDQYLKIDLKSETLSLLTEKLDYPNFETEPTIDGAVEAYKLYVGTLSPKEAKTFELRLWMHSDVTAMDKDSMNAEYNGRVSIITSYEKASAVIAGQKVPLVEEGNGLYIVNHDDADITYTSDETGINNLKRIEYRYAGANPNNYVNFNHELWRIIGLVNTPEGQRVKLIRNESIGTYSWDSSESSINGGFGVNEWSTSKIQEILNHGAYYNRTNGICYNDIHNKTVECDFNELGLTSEAKEMIDTVTWNTGSNGDISAKDINISTFYNLERSNHTGKICSSGQYCNDSVERSTIWHGSVGLMYPSDYGYATSGGTNTNRESCLSTSLYHWNSEDLNNCKENDWLFRSEVNQWAYMPCASDYSMSAFYIGGDGFIGTYHVGDSRAIFPSIYLKSNVRILNGNGSINSPFELSL